MNWKIPTLKLLTMKKEKDKGFSLSSFFTNRLNFKDFIILILILYKNNENLLSISNLIYKQ